MTLKQSMQLIAADCETDAVGLDGAPVASVGTQLGNILAMMQAVANAVARLSEQIDNIDARVGQIEGL